MVPSLTDVPEGPSRAENSDQMRSSDPSSTFVVALQRLGPALVGEPDRRVVGVDPVHRGVGHPEPDVPAVTQPLRDQVDEHLVLGVDHHRPASRQLGEVDPVQPALERQIDAVMDEPVAHHPVAHPGLTQQVHRALLQDPRLDRLLDRLPRLDVDHHRLHPAQVQQVRQQQPGRAGSDDSNLSTHLSLPFLDGTRDGGLGMLEPFALAQRVGGRAVHDVDVSGHRGVVLSAFRAGISGARVRRCGRPPPP